MSPTEYLGLPWKRFGEVDFLLTQGYHAYKKGLCSCGCGQWRAECTNPDNEGRYVVTDEKCNARAALAKWSEANKDAGPEVMLSVRLLSDGETETQNARAQVEAMRRRVAEGLI